MGLHRQRTYTSDIEIALPTLHGGSHHLCRLILMSTMRLAIDAPYSSILSDDSADGAQSRICRAFLNVYRALPGTCRALPDVTNDVYQI